MRSLRFSAVLVCLALLAAACAPLRGDAGGRTVEAVVTRANNLFVGSDVRVLGLRVGRIAAMEAAGPDVRVVMELQPGVELPADVEAHVLPVSLLGERFVQLAPPYVDGPTLPEGEVIPLERTSVPAETDEVLASFETFLEGLDPDTLAELVEVVAETVEGQGQGLNALLDRGATTIRVLADSSGDLMAAVSALADVSETLAARDARLSKAIRDWSSVVRVVSEESEVIVAGMGHLRRLVTELRPLLDKHAAPLVEDLTHLTTALSTVERNLDRIGTMARGSHLLFDGAGRAFEYPEARLKLVNQGEELGRHIGDRVEQRLIGLCERLAEDACANAAFWEAHLPAVLCWDGVVACRAGRRSLQEAFAGAITALPPQAQERLAEEAAQREAEREAQREAESDDVLRPRLPLPDPRLELGVGASGGGFVERFARLLGGRR